VPVLVNVKVHPKSRRNEVRRQEDGSFTVWTTTAPEKGAANEAVERAIAAELGCARSLVRVKSGATSRNKRVEIPSPQELDA